MARDYQFLNIARDYFQFTTNFIEVINVSATHIYHSALELSPLSSIVRKFYYYQQPHPSPRVVIGIPDLWDPSTAVSTKHPYYLSSTWSPCGQFIAVAAKDAVEVWDALTLKLLSTFQSTKDATRFRSGLAYSPDGCSIAGCSDTAIIVWDTQTGGEVTNINCEVVGNGLELVWSSDGKAICTVSPQVLETIVVHAYDLVSGATLSLGTLQSRDNPYLWAHDKSFQIATTVQDQKGWTVNIFEVGSTLTKVGSFPFCNPPLEAFSPMTYRASVSTAGNHYHGPELLILDIRSREILLKESGSYWHPSFSPDASFFAAFNRDHLTIWRYASRRYIKWREFQQTPGPLQFSPTSSSILSFAGALLHILHLDYSPAALAIGSIVTTHSQPQDAWSPSGTFIATTYHGESTITLTNLNLQNPSPSQFIDTDLEISAMVLTGKVLLVKGSDKLVAWLLTEDGVVDGIVGNTRADHNDSLWEISPEALVTRWLRVLRRGGGSNGHLKFSVKDEIAVIEMNGYAIHSYHTGTGEIFKPAEASQYLGRTWYQLDNQQQNECNLYHHDLCKHQGPLTCEWPVSQATLQEGWVKDSEGKHRLWLHPSWRSTGNDIEWLHNVTTLCLRNASELLVIKF